MVDQEPGDRVPARRRPSGRAAWDGSGLLPLINTLLVGIAGVFLATGSVPITVIAGGAAVLLAALIVIVRR